jgi:hypothetical protein
MPAAGNLIAWQGEQSYLDRITGGADFFAVGSFTGRSDSFKGEC